MFWWYKRQGIFVNQPQFQKRISIFWAVNMEISGPWIKWEMKSFDLAQIKNDRSNAGQSLFYRTIRKGYPKQVPLFRRSSCDMRPSIWQRSRKGKMTYKCGSVSRVDRSQHPSFNENGFLLNTIGLDIFRTLGTYPHIYCCNVISFILKW